MFICPGFAGICCHRATERPIHLPLLLFRWIFVAYLGQDHRSFSVIGHGEDGRARNGAQRSLSTTCRSFSG